MGGGGVAESVDGDAAVGDAATSADLGSEQSSESALPLFGKTNKELHRKVKCWGIRVKSSPAEVPKRGQCSDQVAQYVQEAELSGQGRRGR